MEAAPDAPPVEDGRAQAPATSPRNADAAEPIMPPTPVPAPEERAQLPLPPRELVAPGSSGSKVFKVELGYKIMGIGKLDIVDQIFFCNFKLFARWRDPSLIGASPKVVASTWPNCKGLNVFDPELVIINEFRLKECEATVQLKDPKKGEIKWSLSVRGKFKFDALFSNFPYDFLDLRITVRSHNKDVSQMVLTHWIDEPKKSQQDATSDNSGRKSQAAVEVRSCITDQWACVGHRTEVLLTAPEAASSNKSYAEMSVIVMFQRQAHWYVVNVFIVLFSLVILSAAAMTIPAENSGARLEILLGTYFCIIAVKFSLGDKIPKLPYTTLVDRYVIAVYLFVVAVVIESTLVGIIYNRRLCDDFDEGCKVIDQIDNLFFGIHFGVNCLFHLAIYLRIKHCRKAGAVWMSSALELLSSDDILSNHQDFITEVNGRIPAAVTKLQRGKSFRSMSGIASLDGVSRQVTPNRINSGPDLNPCSEEEACNEDVGMVRKYTHESDNEISEPYSTEPEMLQTPRRAVRDDIT